MSRSPLAEWISDRAKTGLRELPDSASRFLQRAADPGRLAESAAEGTRDKARQVGVSVLDAAPVGDSVEMRMKRARAAADRAAEAEQEALEAAQESKQRSDNAKQVAERQRTWLTEVERDVERRVDERVAEAERAAAEQVKREEAAARHAADDEIEEAESQASETTEEAERDADAAEQRAKELLAEARDRLGEARRLADEAAKAARAAADDAHRQAEELAGDAEQQARSADAKVAEVEQVRTATTVRAKTTARRVHAEEPNGSLESYTKAELLDLAAAAGIDGRTNMTKAELISAITKASRAGKR